MPRPTSPDSPAQPPAPPHLVVHDGNPDAVGSRTVLFFRRFPRFTVLLSVLIASLLLLTHTPFLSLQSSPTPPTPTQPLNSSTAPHGLASRVRRAERAYQKMLLGRDALISKVGPTPHNVDLCVPSYPFFFFWLIRAFIISDFYQIKSRGHRIQFVSWSFSVQPRAPIV